MVNLVINKQNDWLVGFDKDIFDVCCVSTGKYPASAMMLEDISDVYCVSTLLFVHKTFLKYLAFVMMLDAMVSNGEKCHLFGLMSATGLSWVKKVTKDTNYIFQQDDAPAHTANLV